MPQQTMMAANPTTAPEQLRWTEKLMFLATIGLVAALFLSIGWQVLAPDDPLGTVSIWTHRGSFLMVIQAAALVLVAAVIATITIGSRLPDVGAFAAAAGLSLVALQGANASHLLITYGQGDRGAERQLAALLAIESLVWFIVLAAALVVSGMVTKWCFQNNQEEPNSHNARENQHTELSDLSVSDTPFLGRSLFAGTNEKQDDSIKGVKVTLLISVTSIAIFSILVSGFHPKAVSHGQSWFAVFAAFFLSTWISSRFFQVRTAFWRILSIPVVCTLGYLWAMMPGDIAGPYSHLPSIPPSGFLHVMPLTLVPVAFLGTLSAHWTYAHPSIPTRQKKREPAGNRRRRR